jgi:uncharacterized protein YceH (UPF0502 family)
VDVQTERWNSRRNFSQTVAVGDKGSHKLVKQRRALLALLLSRSAQTMRDEGEYAVSS